MESWIRLEGVRSVQILKYFKDNAYSFCQQTGCGVGEKEKRQGLLQDFCPEEQRN